MAAPASDVAHASGWAKSSGGGVAEYVRACGGSRAFRKVLIANNGIAAVKAIRSIRRWAYETFGNEREISFVVMATPEDLRANAEYIRMADEFVEVPGGANHGNYANVRLIVETAESVGADAVWAGWGHASENPQLPESLRHAQPRPIAFIGPPPGPMHALGDKIGSTIIAQSAGVPCIAWNGADLRVSYRTEGLPDDVYRRANITSVEEAVAAADKVGYPLMIKASEGGGGKGIRKVMEPAGLAAAYRQVASEVPGSPIFLMRLASRARHLEVQVLADEYGNAIALFGRDCSVQRRHQKIVEEGPVTAAPPVTWSQMERAAVALAREVGYVNAGTVEYLFMEDDGTFAFLELNPRLQVEHPVTEMITGVNLPAAQLQVAMGIPLCAIPDVRRLYGLEPRVDMTTSEGAAAATIPFDVAERVVPQGHVIAARITAENPDSGFQPTSGAVTELNFRSTPDVWGYFSVDSSGRVHEFADSQIGHLFAWGLSREEARQHMVLALKELSIRGDIRTTVEYLVHMMESDDFRANRINTSWLDARISRNVTAAKPQPLLVVAAGAVWRAHAAYEKRRAEFLSSMERGQYPGAGLLGVTDDVELIYDSIKYTLQATRSGANAITLSCNSSHVSIDFRPLSDGGLLMLLGGRSHVAYAKEEAAGLRLVLDGATCIFTNEYDPTVLRVPMSGKLARYLVESGSHVAAGAAYAEVEVMKMYMPLTAPEAGVITLVKPEGSVLEPGDMLARVALDDPTKVHRAEPFTGELTALLPVLSSASSPSFTSPIVQGGSAAGALPPGPTSLVDALVWPGPIGDSGAAAPSVTSAALERYSRRWHAVVRNAMRVLQQVLQGFVAPKDSYDSAWFDFDAAYACPELPCSELEEVFSVLSSRLPARVHSAITDAVAAHKSSVTSALQTASSTASSASVPAMDLRPIAQALAAHAATLSPKDAAAFQVLSAPLHDLIARYAHGVEGAGRAAMHSFLSDYLAVENLFGSGRKHEDILADLRAAAAGQADMLAKAFDTLRAHAHLKQRNALVLAVLRRVAEELELAKSEQETAVAASRSLQSRRAVVHAPSHSAARASPAHAGVVAQSRLRGSFNASASVSSRSLGSDDHDAFVIGTGAAGSQVDTPPDAAKRTPASSRPTSPLALAGGQPSEDEGRPAAPEVAVEEDFDVIIPDVVRGGAAAANVALAGGKALTLPATGRAPMGLPPRVPTDAEVPRSPNGVGSPRTAQRTSSPAFGALNPDVNTADAVATTPYPTTHIRSFLPLLHALATLKGVQYAEVTLEARQILITHQLPSQRQRRSTVASLLEAMGDAQVRYNDTDTASVAEDALQALVEDDQPLLDALASFFADANKAIRRNAAEVYVRRLYRVYSIVNLCTDDGGAPPSVAFASAPEQTVDFLITRWEFYSADATHIHVSRPGAAPGLRAQPRAGTLAASRTPMALMESSLELQSMVASPGTAEPSPALSKVRDDRHSRHGAMVAAVSLSHFVARFEAVMRLLVAGPHVPAASALVQAPTDSPVNAEPLHVLHVTLFRSPALEAGVATSVTTTKRGRFDSGATSTVDAAAVEEEALERAVLDALHSALQPFHARMRAAGVRRITFSVPGSRPTTLRDTHTPLHDNARAFVAAIYRTGIEIAGSQQRLGQPGRAIDGAAAVAMPAMLRADSTGGAALGLLEGSSMALAGFPWIYTFRANTAYSEDSIVRHIAPPSSAHLELSRLSNFRIRIVPTANRIVHVYAAEPREPATAISGVNPEGSRSSQTPRVRYFVRAIVRQTARIPTLDSVYEQYPGPERMFVECLDALSVAMGDALSDTSSPVGNNHIFLNVLPVAQVRPEYVEQVTKILARRYADRLRQLRVSQVEFRISIRTGPDDAPIALRLVSSNPTGYVLRVDMYVEAKDDTNPGSAPIFASIAPSQFAGAFGHAAGSADAVFSRPHSMGRGSQGSDHQVATGIATSAGLLFGTATAEDAAYGGALASLGLSSIHAAAFSSGASGAQAHLAAYRGDLDGKPVNTPYPVSSPYDRQRALAAALSDTVYVYDFIELFSRALEMEWSRYLRAHGRNTGVRRPRVPLSAVELVLRRKSPQDPYASRPGTEPFSPGAALPDASSRMARPATSVMLDQLGNEMGGRSSARGAAPDAASVAGADTSPPSSTRRLAPLGPSQRGQSGDTPVAARTPAAGSCDPADFELVESSRPAGQNDIGMVAWRITMYTPQYPEESGGREIILIANDITFRAGSFGTGEDALFYLASAYARERGIPRVFLAANSGARIGLAEDLKKLFRVAWLDDTDPSKGFRYLYLAPADFAKVAGEDALALVRRAHDSTPVDASGSVASPSVMIPLASAPVHVQRVLEAGEERFVITDIIGSEADLGVENLRGSGLIAGETSRAYASSVTLTYVTGRSVGIGAYLVRLGQRTIQKSSSAPIILTGYEALNKLMGSEVYTSNQQLGGPKIMFNNGVSHAVVDNDFEGVQSILRWLSFVPRNRGAPLPQMDVPWSDSADRDIAFEPPSTPFDPRLMLTGQSSIGEDGAETWVSGLFDRDSFVECMAGWAKSVITGRARLGGIPVGVILPEVRTTSTIVPADPATPDSKEVTTMQAGQVWFPDSAFKTAQAIRDFNGEDLPILILANWRGFSGGARDMFDEVLKFGSYIVDALVECRVPVIVYIPPRGELRGGAWVVVDSSINPSVMEMYADTTARGGVLEPSGIVSIKFRARELQAAAHRLDPVLRSLDAKLKAGVEDASGTRKAIRAREDALAGVYLQVAHCFADLHDTPGRMLAKGVIHGVIPWRRARAFFYWRLRRRVAEQAFIARMLAAAPQLSPENASMLLRQWFFNALVAEGNRAVTNDRLGEQLWRDDVRVLRWLADTHEALLARVGALRRESVAEQVLRLGLEDPSAVVTGVMAMLNRLAPDKREAVVAALRRGVIFGSHATMTSPTSSVPGAASAALPPPGYTPLGQPSNAWRL